MKLKSDKEVQAAQHEVDVLSLLSHRNIVGYYNNYVDSEVMYIEMEYANGGTLSHLIGLQQQPFPEVIRGYDVIIWYVIPGFVNGLTTITILCSNMDGDLLHRMIMNELNLLSN